MIKLMDIIRENSTSSYSYGCVMLYFDFPQIFEIQKDIDDSEIYEEEGDNTYGLEDKPHTTLLYGLHDTVTEDEVKDAIKDFDFPECTVNNISIFANEKYDVLKFDVSGENLKECNKVLKKFPHTTDYPNFHPHLTIGYLKKGKGAKYVQEFKKLEFKLTPKYIIFSTPDGNKSKININ